LTKFAFFNEGKNGIFGGKNSLKPNYNAVSAASWLKKVGEAKSCKFPTDF